MLITKEDLMIALVNLGQKINEASDELMPLQILAAYIEGCHEQFPFLDADDLKSIMYQIVRMK